MKRKINTEKVKELLEKSGKKQIELANHLNIPNSSITMAFKGERGLSMGHIFELANFFNIKPLSLTIVNDTKTKKSEQENRGAKI